MHGWHPHCTRNVSAGKQTRWIQGRERKKKIPSVRGDFLCTQTEILPKESEIYEMDSK